MAHIHPDELDRVVTEMTERLSMGETDPVSFRLRVADGSYKDVETIVQDLTDDPSVGGIVATTRDVTERARAEAMMASQAQILRLIAEGAPLTETLATICGVVEEQMPGSAVLGDARGRGRARAPDRRGAEPARGVRARGRSGPDRAERAARVEPRRTTAPRSSSRTSRTDPRWEGYGDLAEQHGLRACWSTPVMASSGDRVLGTFAVYHRTPHAPTTEAAEIVAMVSPLAAIAIERRTFEDRLALPGAARSADRASEPGAVRRVPHARAGAGRASTRPRRRCSSSTSIASRS